MSASREPRHATPDQLARGLASSGGAGELAPRVRSNILSRLASLRRYLDRVVCSEPWLRHCWCTGDAYPPAADTTPMLPCSCEHCRRTGRLWPPQYCQEQTLSGCARRRKGVIAYECHLESLSEWDAAQLPSSPSGIALRAIREGRISLRRQRMRLGRPRRVYQ